MGKETSIGWCHHTFNAWWGCTRVSEACRFCYAEAFDKRTGGSFWGARAPRRFFGDKHWNAPRKWNEAALRAGERRRVFCSSMADVFEGRNDLDPHRARLWDLIEETPALDWLLLTKRPENIARMTPDYWRSHPRPNVWLGTTVEDQPSAGLRVPHLLGNPAAVRFLSVEPLLGPVNLRAINWPEMSLSGLLPFDALRGGGCRTSTPWRIDWVIVGGESGGGARPFNVEWARSLRRQCEEAGAAFFMKQLGARPFASTDDAIPLAQIRRRGKLPAPFLSLAHPKGEDETEWPDDLRVRSFPEVRGLC